MANYEVNNVSVSSILNWIREGKIAIPEIQRPFVWKASKVRDLIDSLYRGYPTGYIITWANPDTRLKDGTISSGKEVIIDGQQRITALTAALAGQKVIDQDYRKKSIKIAFNPISKSFDVANPAIEKNSAWITDLSILFCEGFDSWSFINQYAEKNNVKANKINEAFKPLFEIKTNNLGVIKLSSELEIDTVTEIFTRINSKGVKLSQADFAMSKIAANSEQEGILIRKTIDYFCHLLERPEDYENIIQNDLNFVIADYFEKIKWVTRNQSTVYIPKYSDILRVVFTYKFQRGKLKDLVQLLTGRDFKTRTFNDEIVVDSFSKLKAGVISYCNQTSFQGYLMILESIGIISHKLVKSQNALNFGYVLYLYLKGKGTSSKVIEKAVRRWVLLSILTQRYSGSAETKFDEDIRKFASADCPLEVIDNEEKGVLSNAFWDTILVDKLTTAKMNFSFHCYMMAQIKAKEKGFLSDEISVQSMNLNYGDLHHVFPKNYLKKNGLNNQNDYNQLANYALVQKETNISIRDKAPAIYLSDYDLNDPKIQKNFQENAMPLELFKMVVTDYQLFLETRRKLMAKKIREFYESFK